MSLKAFRDAMGITQEELALQSGVSRSVIALTESDKRRLKVDAAKKLAPALGVKWWELFEDEGSEDNAERG